MADTKITGLTADASPTGDDLIPTVNDPGGTPANRKVTLTDLFASAPMSAALLSHGASKLLGSHTLGSAASAVAVTGIPATYKHLLVVYKLRGDNTELDEIARGQFNDLSGTYTDPGYQAAYVTAGLAPAGVFGEGFGWILNYTGSQVKQWVGQGTYFGAGTGSLVHCPMMWSGTAAVDAFTFTPHIGSNWVTGSCMHVYGFGG